MKKFYTLIIVLLIINVANAQWQQTNISANKIYCLAVNGNNIFAGTNIGVFLSSNNGSSWPAVNIGLLTDILSLAINNNIIIAGTSGSSGFYSIYLSLNNGGSWTGIGNGLGGNLRVSALTKSGNNIFAGTNYGVYLSSDNGASWTAVNNGLTAQILSLAINGNNIFAGTYNSGIYFSSNNGNTWTGINNTGLTSTYIISLATSGTYIFAGTDNGVFLSTNNGTSWTSMNNGMTNTTNVNTLLINGTNLFAGTNYGVYLSTNNGASWMDVNNGLTNINVRSLAINGTTIFAGTYGGGIFKRSISEILEINENTINNSISIYPNPAKDNLTLNLQQIKDLHNTTVSIYNIQGQLLLRQNIINVQSKLNISTFAKGVYVVKVNNDKESRVSKFVKE